MLWSRFENVIEIEFARRDKNRTNETEISQEIQAEHGAQANERLNDAPVVAWGVKKMDMGEVSTEPTQEELIGRRITRRDNQSSQETTAMVLLGPCTWSTSDNTAATQCVWWRVSGDQLLVRQLLWE